MKRDDIRNALLCVLVATLAVAGPAMADGGDPEDEIEFDVARIFFELNNTDGDLGIHAEIDGGPWKILEIEGPNDYQKMKIALKSNMRKQGLSELRFESAEPTFDELDPRVFFRRFPEGEWEISGVTIDGLEMESDSTVTHLVPAPPVNLAVNGMLVPLDCDEGPRPVVGDPVDLTWDAVTLSHPDLGRTNEPIEVESYEVALENEETGLLMDFVLPGDTTALRLPEGLFESGDQIKVGVLVREVSGNRTGTESCFEVR
ncbi:hypothetical protein ABI59_16010 [Acidobacteria bacterium Mor1]|nr:hypothetical protein ABI59_16010 [Acidobacteria bacterium Mor1]